MFHVFGVIAQFERRLISERTKDGLATARSHGRPPLQALTAQRYRIRRRISQLRFLDSALLQPVCEVGRQRIVAFRDELLGGPVGEQRLDFRTVLVQLAFAGAFQPSDRQAGSPSRAKGFFRPRGDQPRSISAVIFPPKSRSKSSPKIGRRQIDDIYAVSIGYRKSYGGFGTFEPLGPRKGRIAGGRSSRICRSPGRL